MSLVQEDTGAASFVKSEVFARTFSEGMTLVEETANYLDGEGREAAKGLSRLTAMAYAGASMRVTTQLMQIASWLLVLRALREGDMTLEEANDDKYRLRAPTAEPTDLQDGLPLELTNLITNTDQLFARISRIDTDLFIKGVPLESGQDAAAQQQKLHEAFGRR